MPRFLVKAVSETPLSLGGAYQFTFGSIVVHAHDWVLHDAHGPLHRGLLFDVGLDASDNRMAAQEGAKWAVQVMALLAFAMSVGAAPVRSIIAYDHEPGQRDRLVLQYIDLASGTLARRHADPEAFQHVWQAVNAQAPEDRERVLRAITWYRKSVFDRIHLDQFVGEWCGLEVLNPRLKTNYGLPEEETVRTCPHCGQPVVTAPTGAGIKHALIRTGGEALWQDLRDRRIGILHGAKPLSKIVEGIDAPIQAGRNALRQSILDIAGVPEVEWTRFERTPMAIPRPHRLRTTYRLVATTEDVVQLGTRFPHLSLVNTEGAREWEGKVQREVLTPSLRIENYSGTWQPVDGEIEVDVDPDDRSASLRLQPG